MDRDLEPLPASALAEPAGATQAEVERMVALGILTPRDGPAPFLATDAQRVRLAKACERAGLPMAGIASVMIPRQVRVLEARPHGAVPPGGPAALA